jgi:hypothetical protein
MNELDFLRAQVAREQDRMLGLLEAAPALTDATTAVAATAAYLRWTIGRALDRDRAHAHRLEARTLPGDAATIDALAALRAGFAERQRALDELEAALSRQAAGDADASAVLASAIHQAARVHDGLRQHWRALEPAMLRHYLIEDWRFTTRIDADGILEERALHAAVAGAAPT